MKKSYNPIGLDERLIDCDVPHFKNAVDIIQLHRQARRNDEVANPYFDIRVFLHWMLKKQNYREATAAYLAFLIENKGENLFLLEYTKKPELRDQLYGFLAKNSYFRLRIIPSCKQIYEKIIFHYEKGWENSRPEVVNIRKDVFIETKIQRSTVLEPFSTIKEGNFYFKF